MTREDYGSLGAPFALTRHDRDRERDYLSAAMRDAWDYFSADDEPQGGGGRARRDLSDVTRGILGEDSRGGRDLLGLFGGAGIVGLTAGLLGNANIGNTGIPMALIPAGVAYAASAFDVLPDYSRDFRQIGHGALAMGLGLWALSIGLRIQAQRQQAPAIVMAGAPPTRDAARDASHGRQDGIGNCPPSPHAYTPYAQPQRQPRYEPTMLPTPPFNANANAFNASANVFNPEIIPRGPLTEPEMISIQQQY